MEIDNQHTTTLVDLFAQDRRHGGGILGVFKQILDYLGPERAILARVNRVFFRLIYDQPFVELRGEQDRYAIVRGLTRQQVEEILDQTGKRIEWPHGERFLPVVTQWNEPTRGKFCLGQGSFGVLCLGYALRDKKYVGIKVTEGGPEVKGEIEAQAALKGLPHILESKDVCQADNLDGATRLYQVMDLAGLGSVDRLSSHIQDLQDPQFQQEVIRHVACSLLEGLAAMHKVGYYHLDVKPSNLVVDSLGEVWLIDFGCSKRGIDGQINALYSKGDLRYYSPERWLASYGIGEFCQGDQLDGWAGGMTLLELIHPDHLPLDLDQVDQILSLPLDEVRHRLGLKHLASREEALKHYVGQWLAQIPELDHPDAGSIWSLIRGLLETDVNRRMSPAQALEHPSLKGGERVDNITLERLKEFCQDLPLMPTDFDPGTYKLDRMAVETTHAPSHGSAKKISPQSLPLPHFANWVDRPDRMRCIQESLDQLQQTVLEGGRGMGKTQLVLRTVYDPAVSESFSRILWFRWADQPSLLEQQYLTLVEEFNLGTAKISFKEAYQRIEAFRRAEEEKTGKPWLAVFDGVTDRKGVAPYLPDGNVIITTPLSWADEATEENLINAIEVLPLEPPESKALVNRLLNCEDPDTPALCTKLGHVPLTLVQACAYIVSVKSGGIDKSQWVDSRLAAQRSGKSSASLVYGCPCRRRITSSRYA